MEEIDSTLTEKKFSHKNYATAVCLAGIFGIFGIHHFYLERWAMGVFDLSLSIIAITLLMNDNYLGFIFLAIDIIHTVYVTYKLLVGEYKDGYNKVILYPGQKI